mgnify:CR=1 FL=1
MAIAMLIIIVIAKTIVTLTGLVIVNVRVSLVARGIVRVIVRLIVRVIVE